MRKVTMVVLVLMTSCQVSLKRKIGPVTAQTTIMIRARAKVVGRPAYRAAALAKEEYQFLADIDGIDAAPC